jgi:tRNA-dihydrouridine synthase B
MTPELSTDFSTSPVAIKTVFPAGEPLRAPASSLDGMMTGPIELGGRHLASRYFLAPLAGYTHLAFRRVIREIGGVGLCTTDLVQASHLVSGTRWARELVQTHPSDQPLTVQIYGGQVRHMVAAARWLEDHGYQAIDINMGCPMAKMTGCGGGARLMCNGDGACQLVGEVVRAVKLPVSVKMRLGWDRSRLTAPLLAEEFEQLGVCAITIHGRTRQQGFTGDVSLDGIRAVVEAVKSIPVVGNGDVRTAADAIRMRRETGCAAVAIGRGALMDPWIFRRIALAEAGDDSAVDFTPTPTEQVDFLRRHFELMVEQHGEYLSCRNFRKFAAWYGARLGIPEDLEDRLRKFESVAEFAEIAAQIEDRHGTRTEPLPTALIRTPNGPVEYW